MISGYHAIPRVTSVAGFTVAAARSNSLVALEYFYRENYPWGPEAFEAAVAAGSLEAADFLLSRGCPVISRDGDDAYQGISKEPATDRPIVVSGDIEVLRWYREVVGPWSHDASLLAWKFGHFGVAEWIMENQVAKPPEACIAAAAAGDLARLQGLRGEGYLWDIRVCAEAARGGHLHILEWAREAGCPWDSLTFEAATARADPQILGWLLARKCPWDQRVTMSAEKYENLFVQPRQRE